MNATDYEKFAVALMGLSEVLGKEISKGAMSIWFEALKEYDIETVTSAISAHIKSPDNGQFFPKPADIIKMIGGTSKDASFLAWTKVDKAVRMVGPYQTVVFDDPLIHAVISDMGGWIMLGEKTEAEWPFVANDFKARYQRYRSGGEKPDYNGKLIGIAEADNSKSGFAIPAPILIGDVSAAAKVLECAKGKVFQITTASDSVMKSLGYAGKPLEIENEGA